MHVGVFSWGFLCISIHFVQRDICALLAWLVCVQQGACMQRGKGLGEGCMDR